MKALFPSAEQLSRQAMHKQIERLQQELTIARREAEQANARADRHARARQEAWDTLRVLAKVQSRTADSGSK